MKDKERGEPIKNGKIKLDDSAMLVGGGKLVGLIWKDFTCQVASIASITSITILHFHKRGDWLELQPKATKCPFYTHKYIRASRVHLKTLASSISLNF